jgi:hypothetical protein
VLTALVIGAVVVALLWPSPEPKQTKGGDWVPRSIGKVTARQWAVIDKAHRSDDPEEVQRAYFLARSLGFDDPADILNQRLNRLIMKRQEQYPPPARVVEDED